ncbi:isochorismate synthase [Flavobacterium psychrotolerans]|uniref:isochorismate synthase n=1 Tax=Flavobacterium psychrotolerans TaxID=2169410 RepID=A0A2U1JRA2_9FLAO|nr:isochorismate synthase [Flavobacterium psychrotolerans]PWA07358.1 isochorismate synthase [Flavobacterium psychrotolerans]
MIDFFIKVKQQERQNLPFVIYSKPNKNALVGFFQKNDHLYFADDFTESGFVFSPFDGNQIILIPKNQSQKWASQLSTSAEKQHSNFTVSENHKDKEHFKNLVQKGIDSIRKGVLSKVVLSREEIIDLPGFDIVSIFEKLVRTYPTAFCYCWFHPKIGLWMGASPERLLKAQKNQFYTMALAGTQTFEDDMEVIWGNKEKEEQQLVTDFILTNLKDVTTEVNVSSPYTLKSGNLLHIKTDIEGIVNPDSNLKEIVSILHPTPAVCGLPKRVAKDFILQHEGYDRAYYTGFLGELNRKVEPKGKLKSDLYVNLRCMQIKIAPDNATTKVHLYMGCGITKDSIPENEWEESVNKSMTIKKIIG